MTASMAQNLLNGCLTLSSPWHRRI
jgi:hypothetical protein